jgi:hypothetical protein
MNIAVGSAFRNSAHRLERYFEQVVALRDYSGEHVRVIAAEGDSIDGTRMALRIFAGMAEIPLEIMPCDHGGPIFGSTEEQARLDALTGVGNAIFDGVRPADDVLLYVESDLLWDANTAWALIEAIGKFDVVAPLIYSHPGTFYDIFCYRKDGVRFSPAWPYHQGLDQTGITEVDSVGSCLAIRGDAARAVRIPHGGVLIGWCEEARAAGYKIGVAAELGVSHP